MKKNIFSTKLEVIDPSYGSELTFKILELEHLRRRQLRGSTPYEIFMEIKRIFYYLESLASARIEGNYTTLSEWVEQSIKPTSDPDDQFKEIQNIENTLEYIEEHIQENNPITLKFIREIHKKIVSGLIVPPDGEGDTTPGKFRTKPVTIVNAIISPPIGTLVLTSVQELIEFINSDTLPQYDLLKIALTHHRFAAIHPFNNGNGRTVRALTYALLLKYGFSVSAASRILNPTAIFCNDRETYYKMLGLADTGKETDLLTWCDYVISGLKQEVEKIDLLIEFDYVKNKILYPAIKFSAERKSITPDEEEVLLLILEKEQIMNSDVITIRPNYSELKVTRLLRKMKELNLIKPISLKSRRYTISFSNSYLLRGVIQQLDKEGFIPNSLENTLIS